MELVKVLWMCSEGIINTIVGRLICAGTVFLCQYAAPHWASVSHRHLKLAGWTSCVWAMLCTWTGSAWKISPGIAEVVATISLPRALGWILARAVQEIKCGGYEWEYLPGTAETETQNISPHAHTSHLLTVLWSKHESLPPLCIHTVWPEAGGHEKLVCVNCPLRIYTPSYSFLCCSFFKYRGVAGI